MAGATVVTLHIIKGFDASGSCLHGKADVHVAQATGEFGAVEPMIEDNRGPVRNFRKIVELDSAILIGQGSSFLDPGLSEGESKKNEQK